MKSKNNKKALNNFSKETIKKTTVIKGGPKTSRGN